MELKFQFGVGSILHKYKVWLYEVPPKKWTQKSIETQDIKTLELFISSFNTSQNIIFQKSSYKK
jgi:hypothetical protein